MTKQFKDLMWFIGVILICNFGLNFALIGNVMPNLVLYLSATESIVWILIMVFQSYLDKKT